MKNLSISQVEELICQILNIDHDAMPVIIKWTHDVLHEPQVFFKQYEDQFENEINNQIFEFLSPTNKIVEDLELTVSLIKKLELNPHCFNCKQSIYDMWKEICRIISSKSLYYMVEDISTINPNKVIKINDNISVLITDYSRNYNDNMPNTIDLIFKNIDKINEALNSFGYYNSPEVSILETKNGNFLVNPKDSYLCGYFDRYGNIIRVASQDEWNWANRTWETEVQYKSNIKFDLDAIEGKSQRAKIILKAFDEMGFESDPWLYGSVTEDKDLGAPVTIYTYDILEREDLHEKYGYDEIFNWDVVHNDDKKLQYEITYDWHRTVDRVTIEEIEHDGEAYTFISHCYSRPENGYDDRSDHIWETKINLIKGSQLSELKSILFASDDENAMISKAFIENIK